MGAAQGLADGASRRTVVEAGAAKLTDRLAAFWIFSGAFVFVEPSPYELTFFLVLAAALFGGYGLHRSTLGLLGLFVAFIPFATIAAFQVRYNTLVSTFIFQGVTIFLVFTAYFVANYVADAPQRRMRLIVSAYVAAAVFSAAVGTLGYLNLVPLSDFLLRYGRVKAFFNDPNVFAPFLILPAMFLLQRVFLGTGRRAVIASGLFVVLTIGIFLSFSRAAWGHLALSALLVFAGNFFLVAHAREKARMLLIAMGGVLVLGVAIAGMLSIPAVNRLFEVRTTSQVYDEGETGRFGRQGYALDVAISNPLGIGPNEFNQMRVMELPHNSYVNFALVYGWGGALVLYALLALTVWRGVQCLSRPSPNRPLLIPLMATFVPLVIVAGVIDVDHWRHFFLVIGLIWGVTAAYRTNERYAAGRLSALV